MATEPTVMRRYTPPTCSLEIAAQRSPLSKWMGKTALKNLQFKLSFDDPRVSDDDWVVLRGDKTQLAALHDTVSDYVQSFLNQPVSDTVETAVATQTAVAAEVAAPTAAGIVMQPQGLLSHELTLGSLANEKSGDKITLSSTQLADLSSALDEYSAESTTLPKLNQSGKVLWPQFSQWSSPNWAGLAAGVLVVVGLGASLVNGFGGQPQNTETANQASSRDQRLAVKPPLAAENNNAPNPLATIPPLASLPSPSNLPVSGAVTLPTPSANKTVPNTTPQKTAKITSKIATPSPQASPKVKIVDVPKVGGAAGRPIITLNPADRKPAPRKPLRRPTAPSIDKIGGSVPVAPIPDQTKLAAAQAKRAKARQELAKLERRSAKRPARAGTLSGSAAGAGALSNTRARGDFANLPELEAAPLPPAASESAAAPAAPAPAADSQLEKAQANDGFFDNRNAQAASVRRYFQGRWSPPKDLKQSIQYQLEIDANGSLKTASPLGATAEKLQSQVIPSPGAKIAPASKNGKGGRVRLLLEDSGSVKAFPQ